MARERRVMDGNEAAADVAFRTNEVIAIYPITPSSPMGEWSDAWSSAGKTNSWGATPFVQEMQSEGGAAGAVHGALQTGSLTCTFTASQGLLLMIPNMYKIAGELTPTVFHVAARTVATHALSIFCDHSDVMAVRQTGFALLASQNPQQVMDMALIAQAATLRSRVPFVHFFDGFRTSHELSKVEVLTDDDIRSMVQDKWIHEHRERALSPDHPVMRGSAQNPDVFFQAREACNPFYNACAGIVEQEMKRFGELTGRRYKLFDYHGHPQAERVIVVMGSAADTACEVVDQLVADGERVGVLAVHLYRPFSLDHFVDALPEATKSIAVLDRTKEPGAIGDPLYLDVVTTLREAEFAEKPKFEKTPHVVGGRYGLSSKEFTPAMVKTILDELRNHRPRNHFTVGIEDDVTGLSLPTDPSYSTEDRSGFRGLFYGLGSDGTVSANKNSIKILGEDAQRYVQGYFVYDSKKAGAVTVSHLRFGKQPIRSAYLIHSANFIACHQFGFLDRVDMLSHAEQGAAFLLNCPHPPEEVWDHLPREVQEQIVEKELRLYAIDAIKVARAAGMGTRINTIMQICFFAIADILPIDEAVERIKAYIQKAYGSRGEVIIRKNFDAVDSALAHLHEVKTPGAATSQRNRPPVVPIEASEYVQTFTSQLISGQGDFVPVSALSVDGTFPTGTAHWERRNIAHEIPVWDPDVCIQCAKCAMVCPHAAIRVKVFEPEALEEAPANFLSSDFTDRDYKSMNLKVTYQTAPEDCTGCSLCVHVCPAKNKSETRLKAINMTPVDEVHEREKERYKFFLDIPEMDRTKVRIETVKGSQLLQPLFEYSGACAGCGETPYVKLVSQMYGDRLLVANATGCSSIYGGNLPTTPWAKNQDGRGPAWSNSLFEDNAEFGLGFRISIDHQTEQARSLVQALASDIGDELTRQLLEAPQDDEADIFEQRKRVAELKSRLEAMSNQDAKNLLSVADCLVKKSVWLMGGDGWAYDIGYGGLDHALASGHNINVLVLDTEVYSNTGGQASKATPLGAVAKFASNGKSTGKKDLGLLAMGYGSVYVSQIAMGASDVQTVKAIAEAEKYDGPSLIIAYSHCIAHGIHMEAGMEQQKHAVRSGHWILYRFDPRRKAEGLNPLQLDCKAPSMKFAEFAYNETRYRMLRQARPKEAAKLLKAAQKAAIERWDYYHHLASLPGSEQAQSGQAVAVETKQ